MQIYAKKIFQHNQTSNTEQYAGLGFSETEAVSDKFRALEHAQPG